MGTLNDNAIIELFFMRDERAIAETRALYGGKLRRLAFNLLKNREDAEECESETYLKAWNAIPPTRPTHLPAYLMKICRNIALNRLAAADAAKRSAVIVELTAEMEQCIPSSYRDRPAFDGLYELIDRFLRSIDYENRVIFMRRYFFADSIDDISQLLGASRSKVKSSLFRTRGQLKKLLEKEGIDL